MSNTNKNRKVGAVVAYTTLACSLVSLGVYVYRKQIKGGTARPGNNNTSHNDNNNVNSRTSNAPLDDNPRNSLSTQRDNRSPEAQPSSLSRLGSKIARTVKRNRKIMTISIKNTIVWNPSPDPTTPNYGFVEGVIPLLFHLAENHNLHLILLCHPTDDVQQSSNGKDRERTVQEMDELKHQQQLGQARDREQILTMLSNAGLIVSPGSKNGKLIDPRQLLVCETEEGVGHVVRHLESQIHVEAQQNVLEMVQGVVPKVVFVQKKGNHSGGSPIGGSEDIMTRSHIRGRSSSSSSSSGSEDVGLSGVNMNGSSTNMGDSFVEVVKASAHTPLVSGYVTQAGKKGYVEVTDQLMKSSLNPENTQ